MKAWIVRAGAHGERDEWALANGVAGGGFTDYPDLTNVTTRQQLAAIGQERHPGEPQGRIAGGVGQMWAMRCAIQTGDLVVLPLKTTKNIALGTCVGRYQYLADQPEDRRHPISITWKRTDVARSEFKGHLLYTINGALTIFQAARNNAVMRLTRVLNGEVDPGNTAHLPPEGSTGGRSSRLILRRRSLSRLSEMSFALT